MKRNYAFYLIILITSISCNSEFYSVSDGKAKTTPNDTIPVEGITFDLSNLPNGSDLSDQTDWEVLEWIPN